MSGPATAPGPPAAWVGQAIEAILFVSDEPVSATTLGQILEVGRAQVESALGELARQHEQRASGLVLKEVAGGWRLMTHPDARVFVEQFVLTSRHTRLTKASLETLAVVAYKQPVTRHQISSIRGVDSDGVLRSLVERGLVQEVGRDDRLGRAVLYGTTTSFLERLGLPSLADLPPVAPLLDAAGEERAFAPPA